MRFARRFGGTSRSFGEAELVRSLDAGHCTLISLWNARELLYDIQAAADGPAASRDCGCDVAAPPCRMRRLAGARLSRSHLRLN